VIVGFLYISIISTKWGNGLRKACYKKLWKLLIDKDLNKKMLAEMSGVSASTLTKMSKGESVNVDILVKICNALDCEIQDIMELVPLNVSINDVSNIGGGNDNE